MGKKKTKKKLKKRIGTRLEAGERALVVCVGKKCAPREESRAVLEDAKAYVAKKRANGETAKVRVTVFGCLGICKKGPIAATLPRVHFSKKVDTGKVRAILDELFEAARAAEVETLENIASADQVGLPQA